jgi:hypothetical protein
MAQQPYDPNVDDKYAPRHLSEAEESAASHNSETSHDSIATPNSSDLTAAEQHTREASPLPGGSEGSERANDTVGRGYTPGNIKKKGFRGTIQGLSRSRKALLVGCAGGGGGLIALILLLFLLASSLKIPNLVQNITTYEFARVTRQYSESANRITTEKLAADAMEERSWTTALKDKYQSLRNNTWGKFDKYRPQQVMKNLSSENNFQLTYRRTGLTGRPQLVGVTLNDETHLAIQSSAKTRFVPGLNSLIDFKNNVSLSKRLAPALDTALRDKDIGPIIRGSVAKKIRQELGINLVAWTLGKFQGKDAQQARLEEARQKAATIDEKTPPNDAVLSSNKEAISDAEEATQETLKDDKKLQAAINNNGVSTSVKDAISKAIAKTPLQDVVGVINPIYGVAVPVCIVYDGSLDHSGPTIDNQTRQQVAAYSYLASADAQQRAGSQDSDPANATALATAINATNDDVGDISDANAIKRANGETVDTSGSISPEASAGGEFTLLDATPGIPSGFASLANNFAGKVCPAVTNIYLGIGLGIANIGVGIFTGGSSEIGEGTAEAAATQVLDNASANLASRMLTTSITKLGKVRDLLFDTAKSGTKIAAATVVAKLIVNSQAGTINGGLTQGKALADEADSGAGIYAGMLEQQQMYGRPLTQSEVAQSDQADQQTVMAMNSSKSMYERYLATDNSFSLLSRMAMAVSGNMSNSFLRSLVSIASTLLHPLTYFGSFATSLTSSAHAAANDTHYGNVQFGWSEAEENLIDSNESYSSSLENQAALDASGQEDAIANVYSKCFTESIGDALSSGDIQRDSAGNVLPDKGLCSPNNLGPTNNDPSSPCGTSGCGDLVFRYRLAMQYSNTLDQLTNLQDVTN